MGYRGCQGSTTGVSASCCPGVLGNMTGRPMRKSDTVPTTRFKHPKLHFDTSIHVEGFVSSHATPPFLLFLGPVSSFCLLRPRPSIFHDAGLYQTDSTLVSLGCNSAPAEQEGIQRQLQSLLQDYREPEGQCRHKGHLPGLHRKAGNVSVCSTSAAVVLDSRQISRIKPAKSREIYPG